jgi:hypothetical protein
MTASSILKVLGQLGFNVPITIESKVLAGELGTAVNFKISVKDIDAALAKTQLSISDRLKLKYSASQAGLLA